MLDAADEAAVGRFLARGLSFPRHRARVRGHTCQHNDFSARPTLTELAPSTGGPTGGSSVDPTNSMP